MRLIALLAALMLAGCSTTPEQVDRVIDLAESVATNFNAGAVDAGTPASTETGSPALPPPSPAPVITNAPPATPPPASDDFAGLKFRNSADCRDWPVTVTVSDVALRGGNITWRESGHASTWNQKSSGGKTIDGETILLIPSIGAAGMFDYKRVGQREKILSNLKPSHEGQGFFPGWVPVKGERVGFCIATISRDRGAAKMKERSNVVWFTWPRDGI